MKSESINLTSLGFTRLHHRNLQVILLIKLKRNEGKEARALSTKLRGLVIVTLRSISHSARKKRFL